MTTPKPDPKFDISKIASGNGKESVDTEVETQQSEGAEITAIIPTGASGQTVIQSTDLNWIEATQGLQGNLIRSLRDYKATRGDRRALAVQRERMISEVTEQYVNYLREEAKLTTNAALQARDTILRKQLTELKGNLYAELADITGSSIKQIEQIFQNHMSQINSPQLQQMYAKYVMGKLVDLLEQTTS